MTALRFAHQTRASIANRRDETPQAACIGAWSIYDALIDGDAREVRYAVPAAREICGSCPLQATCFADNREELWAQTILRGYRRKSVTGVRGVGAAENAAAAAEYNAARLAQLEQYVADNLELADILQRVDMRRDSLRVWCRRNGHMDLWAALTRRNMNTRVMEAVADLRAGDYADATVAQLAERLGMTTKALEQHFARARRRERKTQVAA